MKTLTVKFSNKEAARRFMDDMSLIGDGVSMEIAENAVTLRSADNRMVTLVREIQEDSRMRSVAESMLRAIVECVKDKTLKQITFMDGSVGRMTRQQAMAMSKVHDRLDETNRAAFLILSSQDKESFEKVVEFSKRNEGEVA